MTNIEAYKIWAPDNALWTEWAKPVLFAGMMHLRPVTQPVTLDIQSIYWLNIFNQNTAIIVDLPEEKSVEESLALAYMGYRPVPLYNGVYAENQTNMTVDVGNLSRALLAGAEVLASINFRNDAPPVFMLDSRRMKSFGKAPGSYDNRWCVFPQDMPSASFLIRQKINRVIVRTEQTPAYFNKKFFDDKIQNDLTHILCRYQEAGIKIQLSCGSDDVNDTTVSKPSKFKSLFYRLSVTLGLSRNAAGGFGSQIPVMDSDGGSHFRAG